MSGASAAKRLKELGYTNIEILEGSDRVGGRIIDNQIGNYVVEMGSWYVQGAGDNPIYALMKQYNVSYQQSDGEDWIVRDKNGQDITSEAELVYNRLEPAIEAFETHAREARTENKADYTIKAALREEGWRPATSLDDTIEFIEFDAFYSHDPGETSAKYAFYSEPQTAINSSTELIIKDTRGYAVIIENMLNEIIGNNTEMLKLNKTVTGIAQGEHSITVTVDGGETYDADYVVLTFSLGVLQDDRVTFTPALPEWKQDAIQHFLMGYVTRIYIQFAESFWDDVEEIVHVADEDVLSNFVNMNKIFPGSNILSAEAHGKDAIRLERLSDADVIQEIRDKLMQVYPTASVPNPVNFKMSRFSNNPLFLGAWSNWPPGYTKDNHDALKAPIDHIFFAGEHTDFLHYGFLRGAYYSGREAADQIISCMDHGHHCEDEFVPLYAARGCTYDAAKNYNASAREDNGSCEFETLDTTCGSESYQGSIRLLIFSIGIVIWSI